jgi:predicted amidohydrolase YtcJ
MKYDTIKEEALKKKAIEELKALAKVGITALIDEATGYQDVRDTTALKKIHEENK